MIGGSVHRNVGDVTRVIAGDAGTGLPGRLGEVLAATTAGAGGRAVDRAVIPGDFGNVRLDGAQGRVIRGVPISPAALLKFGAADGGNFGDGGRDIHRETGLIEVGAVGRAAIAGGRKPRDALRVTLLRPSLQGGGVAARHVAFAGAVAGADDRREVGVDGVLYGVEHVGSVDIENGGVFGDGAGPLEIEMGFVLIALTDAGILCTGNENYLRVGSRESVLGAEGLDVGEIDLGLSGDDEALAFAVVAGAL